MSLWKEYGFWDRNLPERGFSRRENYITRISQLQDRPEALTGRRKRQLKGLETAVALMDEPDRYMEHFIGLANEGDRTWTVGDITPSYCRLNATEMRVARQRLSDAGFDVRPFFLMRDPVDRLVSAFNMKLAREPLAIDGHQNWDEVFLTFVSGEAAQSRTRFERTVRAMDETFGSNVFYGFFEELFTQRETLRLLDYLNLSPLKAPTVIRVNRGKKKYKPSPYVRQEVRHLFRETYEFCSTRFSGARGLQKWQF